VPEEGEEEVVLRPKIRKDANNPFVMVPCRPQAPAQPNRLSRSGFYVYPGSEFFPSWIRIRNIELTKNLSILNVPKKLLLSSQTYKPGCLSPDLGFGFLSSPPGSQFQGSKGHRILDPCPTCPFISTSVSENKQKSGANGVAHS
jgi:hypothetical protein